MFVWVRIRTFCSYFELNCVSFIFLRQRKLLDPGPQLREDVRQRQLQEEEEEEVGPDGLRRLLSPSQVRGGPAHQAVRHRQPAELLPAQPARLPGLHRAQVFAAALRRAQPVLRQLRVQRQRSAGGQRRPRGPRVPGLQLGAPRGPGAHVRTGLLLAHVNLPPELRQQQNELLLVGAEPLQPF